MHKTLQLAISCLLSAGSVNAADQCPTLNLQTLPAATCSGLDAPFKTAPLSKMSYISTTGCPSGIGMRKKLQEIFKGKKEYPGKQTTVDAGEVKCTYTLDDNWKKAIGTVDPTLTLTAKITNVDQVNYLSGATCPILNKDLVDQLKDFGKPIKVESTRKQGLVYDFSVNSYKTLSAWSTTKGFFTNSSSNISLTDLRGKLEVTKQFAHDCEYNHNTGGSPTKSTLRGVQEPPVSSK